MKRIKRFLSLLLALALSAGIFAALPPQANAASAPFADVAANAWYAGYVDSARETGLLNGVSETSFAPDGTLSIAQAVTMAARLSQYAAEGRVTLVNGTDVWYSTYADYAVAAGIITAGAFDGRWSDEATRAELVQILYPALPASRYAVKNTVEDDAIPDVRTADPWGPEVYAFYRAGVLTGGDGNRFNPGLSITRCEVAAVLARMLDPELRGSVTLTVRLGYGVQELPSADPSKTTLPGIDDSPTHDNVLALLSVYDPDGEYIMQSTYDNGYDYLVWWFGSGSVLDHLGVAVHEQCHMFASINGGWSSEGIYIGGGQYVKVNETQVYNSLEMATGIPQELRTYRYSYVGEEQQYLTSQTHGAYGLLDEFCAYYWGSVADIRMLDYYALERRTAEQWLSYVQNATSSYYAYAEFRFFILRYLMYAKESYPDVYSGIIGNDSFRKAFSVIDQRFSDLCGELFDKLDEAETLIHRDGYSASRTGEYFFVENSGCLIFTDTYETLMTEMEKPEYKAIAAQLRP